MAEEEKDSAASPDLEGADSSSGMGKKKKIIIVSIVIFTVLVVELATAWLIVKWIKGEDPTQASISSMEEDEAQKIKNRTKIGTTLEAPIEVVVNIAGAGGDHYLKCAIQFEWDSEEYPKLLEKINERLVKIRHLIIDILSDQSMSDLMKSTGKDRIRDSIKSEINGILPVETGQINSVFFQEFIVQ